MNDLMILSWNLEKKSLGAFQNAYGSDTLERIVKGMVDAVKLGGKGIDTPFVGFLHEIKGRADRVRQMCVQLTAEYYKQTGKIATFEAYDAGGKGATAERMIVTYSGVDVAISPLSLKESMEELVASDKAQANTRAAEHDQLIERRGLRKRAKELRYNPYKNLYVNPFPDKSKGDFELQKQNRNRDFRHEANWVRGGLIAEITHGADKIKVASIHAPGPKFSNDKKLDIVTRIMDTAATKNVDILIGDFNKRGTISSSDYEDLTEGWKSGTSLQKKTLDLSQSKWDRVFADKGRTFNIQALDPIKITRPADLGPQLTDHALIAARVSSAPMRNNNNNLMNNNNWVNNNNNWVADTPLTASSGAAENILAPVLAPSSGVEGEQTLTSSGEVESIVPSNPFPRVESPLVTRRAESPLSTPPVPSAPPVLETNSLAATEKASSANSLLNPSSPATADAFGSTVEARMLALKLPPVQTGKIASEEEGLAELV